MISFFLGCFTLVVGALFPLLLKVEWRARCVAISSVIAGIHFLVPAAHVLISGETLATSFAFSPLFGSISLVLDPLAAFFLVIVSVGSLLSSLYAVGSSQPFFLTRLPIRSHLAFRPMLQLSLALIVTLQNALAFLIAWELMSLLSFLLSSLENEKKDVLDAGVYFLVAMHVGVLALICAFSVMANTSGSMDFASFRTILDHDRHLAEAMFGLAFFGFATKAGFVPLHTWAPKTDVVAPSHVSAMLSGVTTKMGIFGILRMLTLMPTPSRTLSLSVLGISMFTALWAIMSSITQKDIKKCLAYSSIENIGIIGIGIGVGMLGLSANNSTIALLGFSGALLHVLSHTLLKTILFCSAGSLEQASHTRNIEELGGVSRNMPQTTLLFFTGAMGLCALPPFSGFVSEFLIYAAFLAGITQQPVVAPFAGILSMVGLAFVGGMALLSFTRLLGIGFLGEARTSKAAEAREVSLIMRAPLWAAAAASLLLGIFPEASFALVSNAASGFVPNSKLLTTSHEITQNLRLVGLLSLAFCVLCAILWKIRSALLKDKVVASHVTWGCGYAAGTPRIQYTGISFAAPFVELVQHLMPRRRDLRLPVGHFPTSAHLFSTTFDLFEHMIVEPLVRALARVMRLFRWIQSGSTQLYILYGVLFLIITLIWVLGVSA